MILRVIRGTADRATVRGLRAALVETIGLGPTPNRGPDRYHLGVRPGSGSAGASDSLEVLLLDCWDSAESAAAGDAQQISPMRLATRHLGRVEVSHFEIDMNVLRDTEAQPIAMRMATGSFLRPGGDIQMQELLRARMPGLGPEMTEAYVGRRLHGRAVDVTFVSLWARLPGDHRLEAPFWADISVRYDDFSVEVYGPIDEASTEET